MSEYVSDKMSEEGQNLRQMERQRNCRVKCKDTSDKLSEILRDRIQRIVQKLSRINVN